MPTCARRSLPITDPRHPLSGWARAVVCVWVVLFGALSTAQAAHTHGAFRLAGSGHVQAELCKASAPAELPGSEAMCPLCMAMHLAVPAPALPAVHMVLATRVENVVTTAVAVPQSTWHFDLFGRPPPALRYS